MLSYAIVTGDAFLAGRTGIERITPLSVVSRLMHSTPLYAFMV